MEEKKYIKLKSILNKQTTIIKEDSDESDVFFEGKEEYLREIKKIEKENEKMKKINDIFYVVKKSKYEIALLNKKNDSKIESLSLLCIYYTEYF